MDRGKRHACANDETKRDSRQCDPFRSHCKISVRCSQPFRLYIAGHHLHTKLSVYGLWCACVKFLGSGSYLYNIREIRSGSRAALGLTSETTKKNSLICRRGRRKTSRKMMRDRIICIRKQEGLVGRRGFFSSRALWDASGSLPLCRLTDNHPARRII